MIKRIINIDLYIGVLKFAIQDTVEKKLLQESFRKLSKGFVNFYFKFNNLW